MRSPTGIILAAGRGSRLGSKTAETPKCLVEVANAPLLDHQHRALRAAGLDRIVVVTGYRSEAISSLDVETLHAPRWAETNMVGTLAVALEAIPPPYLVSYSDIVYDARPVAALLDALLDGGEHLAITYDTDWEAQWAERFADPASDAESFSIDEDGGVREIGRPIDDLGQVAGQFMGLLALDDVGRGWILGELDADPGAEAELDTTGLLDRLIRSGRRVAGVPVAGGWVEIDTPGDLQVAERMHREGRLPIVERAPW